MSNLTLLFVMSYTSFFVTEMGRCVTLLGKKRDSSLVRCHKACDSKFIFSHYEKLGKYSGKTISAARGGAFWRNTFPAS